MRGGKKAQGAALSEPPVREQRELKHVQIREHVRALLVGAPPGAVVPSERELVATFGVARMTVRQALEALVAEGVLERVRGRGTFVARAAVHTDRISSFTEDLRRRGVVAQSQTLRAGREEVAGTVADRLGLVEGDPVLHWRRLRRGDGVPVCVEDAYLLEWLLPDFPGSGLPDSLYAALEARGQRPTSTRDFISAGTADPQEATLLEVAAGSVVLRHERCALVGERIVEVSHSVYRADRFTLSLEISS